VKGDRLVDQLRLAGITGTTLTITGEHAALLAELADQLALCLRPSEGGKSGKMSTHVLTVLKDIRSAVMP
jgi:hypothetical protein